MSCGGLKEQNLNRMTQDNITTNIQLENGSPDFTKRVLPSVFCRRISTGKYYVKIGEHEYEIYNHGYYAPDKCVWWEATNLKTNEADFHEHSKSQLLKIMQRELH